MSKLMLVNAGDDESRVAIVDKGVLQDLHVESVQAGRTRGNVYKGTVVRVEPAIQACFVDYGAERNGFLANGDIAKRWWKKGAPNKKRARIEEVVAPGMHLMVQSVKEPEGRKGAALTTRISLPGRYLVFMPDDDSVGGVSRKIDAGAERTRLKKLMDAFCKARDCALIVRSVAAERTKAELERDLGYLASLWKTILSDFKRQNRPGIVFSEQDVVVRCIRDYFAPDVDRVLVDDPQAYKRALEYVRAAMPRHRKRFELYSEDVPLLLRHGVEAQIEEIYRKRVRLPSGGEIVIDPTEALVSVDVNSGKSMGARSMEETALNTNVEAAVEVARQLRLRDLGGLIVVDFIDLRDTKNKKKVERALKSAMKDDKARHNIGRIGQFGLLEMSRQRLQGTVASASHEPCPSCRGAGVIRSASSGAAAAIRRIRSLLADASVNHVEAALPRAAALYLLNEKRTTLSELEAKTGATISVVPTDLPPDEQGQFTPRRGDRALVTVHVTDDEQIAAELAEAEAAAEAAATELEAEEAAEAERQAAEEAKRKERAEKRAAAREAKLEQERAEREAKRQAEAAEAKERALIEARIEADEDGVELDEEEWEAEYDARIAAEAQEEEERRLDADGDEEEGEGRRRRRRRRSRGRGRGRRRDKDSKETKESAARDADSADADEEDSTEDGLPPIAGEEGGETAEADAEGEEPKRRRRRRRRGGRGRGRKHAANGEAGEGAEAAGDATSDDVTSDDVASDSRGGDDGAPAPEGEAKADAPAAEATPAEEAPAPATPPPIPAEALAPPAPGPEVDQA